MSLSADDWLADEFAPMVVEVNSEGTTSTITLAGEFDLAQRDRFLGALEDVAAAAPEFVVLDLSNLDFIDSSGMHGVIRLMKWADQEHVRLLIRPGPGAVQRAFELAGLTARLPFAGTRGDGDRAA